MSTAATNKAGQKMENNKETLRRYNDKARNLISKVNDLVDSKKGSAWSGQGEAALTLFGLKALVAATDGGEDFESWDRPWSEKVDWMKQIISEGEYFYNSNAWTRVVDENGEVWGVSTVPMSW